jgi:hypothetical protein
MVVDSCQDCSAGNLVASSAGLRSLSGGVNVNANPTLQVAWAFESCAPLITGKRGASGGAVEEQQGGWGRLGEACWAWVLAGTVTGNLML